MNKKTISHDFSLIVRVLDNTDPDTFDGFKSLDDAMNVAAMHKSYGDDVWWIDDLIVYDDGSTVHDRHYVDWLDGYIT